jgi:high-affinity nickel-transport protein
MDPLPQDFLALSLVVFALGLKHGFDPDHLATIDGLTRFNAHARPALARCCGALFSLGHGAVVTFIALGVSALADHSEAPRWLQTFGGWVSVVFLTVLGALNIGVVLHAHPAQLVQPRGVKGRFLGRLTRASSPGLVALVGGLFAISFDTVSQAALFALAATRFGGWQHALLTGALFMLGMLLTDGLNGLWVSRLMRRADQTARIASRVMSLVVGGVSLLAAAFGIAKLAVPAFDAWFSGKEAMFGAAVFVVIAASFPIAVRLTAPRMAAASAD